MAKFKNPIQAAEYARINGLSKPAVLKAIRDGRLPSNGKSGRECRVDGDFSLADLRAGKASNVVRPKVAAASQSSSVVDDGSLLSFRKKKLETDIRIADMRLETRQYELQSEAIATFVERLQDATAYLRKVLGGIGLTTEQVAAIGDALMRFDDEVRRECEHEAEAE